MKKVGILLLLLGIIEESFLSPIKRETRKVNKTKLSNCNQQMINSEQSQGQRYGPPGYIPPEPLGPDFSAECPANDPELNRQLVLKAYQEVLGDLNLNNINEYFTQDYIQHNPMAADGLDALRELVKMIPDPPQQIQFFRTAAEGDLVWTHSKSVFFGSTYAAVDIFRVECGKIKEHWDVLQDIKLDMPAKNTHPFF